MLVPFDLRQNERGKGRISRGQPRLHRKGAGPQRSPVLGVVFPSIYASTLWRRTTRFGVATTDMASCFSGSAIRQHKCFARFVSDSWISCAVCCILDSQSVACTHTHTHTPSLSLSLSLVTQPDGLAGSVVIPTGMHA